MDEIQQPQICIALLLFWIFFQYSQLDFHFFNFKGFRFYGILGEKGVHLLCRSFFFNEIEWWIEWILSFIQINETMLSILSLFVHLGS
jgi:hypothetical protein